MDQTPDKGKPKSAKPAKTPKSEKPAKAGKSAQAANGAKAKKKPTRAELKAKKRRSRTLRRVIGRIALYLFTVIAVVLMGTYALLGVVFNGPEAAADQLTLMLMESSAGKFVPRLFYTDEQIAAIEARNSTEELTGTTDASLITVAAAKAREAREQDDEIGPAGVLEENYHAGVTVEELKGATWHGWMLIVDDPSRVMLGVSTEYFTEDKGGLTLDKLAEKYDAIAAINGGAFSDPQGQGNGGLAEGVTMTEGRMTNAHGGSSLTTVGFDKNDVLIVGKMTRAQAEEMGMRDCCSFGPALVINGEGAKVSGSGSGLNPRTAIGQRADGSVLMLVIDGRQVNSPGASMADLVEVMLRYGAVNACNLDGGSSSNIYYDGEILNDGVAIIGARPIPTAFVVR